MATPSFGYGTFGGLSDLFGGWTPQGGQHFTQEEVFGQPPSQEAMFGEGFLPEQYFREQSRKRRIYESRFGDILSGFGERKKLLEGMGETAKQDIERQFQGQSTQANQDLVSRGLTGTTVAPTVQAGITRAKTQEQGRLAEQLRREQIGNIAQEQAFRERFAPPEMDLGFLANLLGGRFGSAGGGGGRGPAPTGRGGQGIGPAPVVMGSTGYRNVGGNFGYNKEGPSRVVPGLGGRGSIGDTNWNPYGPPSQTEGIA